ncbi:unnamed protein product [Camellia sinensis]
MTNQELIDNGNRTMDEADQAIDRSKKVSISILLQSTQQALCQLPLVASYVYLLQLTLCKAIY